MEDEGLDRPFRFIVTGQYLAIHYHDSNFEICRDYHARGSLFYLSDDGEAIIHNHTYVGVLADHPDYEGDVFYIRNGSQYLTQDGKWVNDVNDAVNVQIDPVSDYGDAEPPIPPPIPNPVIDTSNPISADGVDLYHPDKWFSLYPINGDSLWTGDAGQFGGKLYFGGNSYSDGMCFQLSKLDRKTQIRSLTVNIWSSRWNLTLLHTLKKAVSSILGSTDVPDECSIIPLDIVPSRMRVLFWSRRVCPACLP